LYAFQSVNSDQSKLDWDPAIVIEANSNRFINFIGRNENLWIFVKNLDLDNFYGFEKEFYELIML